MDSHDVRQLRGAVELLTATVDAAAAEIAEVHHAIAGWPYKWLAYVPGVAVLAGAVELIQHALTGAAYGVVRALNRLAGMIALLAVDCLEARTAAREP